MIRGVPISLALLCGVASSTARAAEGAGADLRSGYHVLSPTPRALMRDMETDRPDITESPFTVDPGHVQIETDAVSSEREQGSTEWLVATSNFKLGLLSRSDLQLIVEPYRHADGVGGFGDLTLRNKWNVWGNDGGDTAFALMPFVRFPTAREGLGTGHVEAGLVMPLAIAGPGELEVATMLELDASYHDDHYGADLIASCSAQHPLVADLEGFLEIAATAPLDAVDETELQLDTGVVLPLGDDAAVDASARFGLSEAAPDLAWFIGGSLRY